MIDYAKHRTAMVDSQLRPNDVTDRRILNVMGSVPRENFLPEERRSLAYIDEDLPVGSSVAPRYLLAPMPFARLVQLGEVGSDDVVLDIACGTGYSTAVLAQLASSVVAIEDSEALVELANENLAALDIGNAAVVEGQLIDGVPSEAPFDVIIIEGAVEEIPEELFAQLKEGGRLVAIERSGAVFVAAVYIRSGDEFTKRVAFNAGVPSLKAFAKAPQFQF